MLKWFRDRRRKRLRRHAMPESGRAIIHNNVPYFRMLPLPDQQELLEHTQVLLHEKHFEGCSGFIVTDETRLTIAAHAACLLLHRDTDYFPRLKTILIYPSIFLVHEAYPGPDGTVSAAPGEHAGQSWDLGVIVLAWDEVRKTTRKWGSAYNVVLHEFAHQLDLEDHMADGAPILGDPKLSRRWADIMMNDYERLIEAVERGRRTVLDEYAITDEAEFFAVATETFFETPLKLQRHHPDLYEILSQYYRQDPAVY